MALPRYADNSLPTHGSSAAQTGTARQSRHAPFGQHWPSPLVSMYGLVVSGSQHFCFLPGAGTAGTTVPAQQRT